MKKTLIKRTWFLVVSGVVVVGAGIFFFTRSSVPAVEEITVKRGSVVQQVRVTGQFKPEESVKLGFERTGRVVRVAADVGSEVVSGSILVVLDQAELSAQLAQARATVSTQQAKLDELERGTRPESITVSETQVQSAEVALNESQHSYVDAIRDAYAKTNDAIRGKIDVFFLNPRTSPQLQFSVSDSQLKVNLESGRVEMESRLDAWAQSLVTLASVTDLTSYDTLALTNLSYARDFLSTASLALNNVTAGGSLTQATLDGWRANVSAGLSAVSTAITTLSAGREGYRNAQSALKVAKSQLALIKAGATGEEIAAQAAQVEQAAANVLAIEAQLSKTVIRSPIKGIVTSQDAKVGQIVSPNVTVVSVISQNNLEIEANVPEVDVGKIQIGNAVTFTIDALPGEEFKGALTHIDPAETVIDGVANFKTKASLTAPDARFKSGLTVNLIIETLKKENVLTIPQYAILENDNGIFVKIKKGNTTEDIPVKLGVRGENGLVEILSGVAEGDKVLNIGIKAGGK